MDAGSGPRLAFGERFPEIEKKARNSRGQDTIVLTWLSNN